MAATVQLAESNGAGEVVTKPLSRMDYVSVDQANAVAADNPITPDPNGVDYVGSYKKYVRLFVSALNGVQKIKTIKVWRLSGTPTGSDLHKCNLTTSGYSAASYATPSTSLMSGAGVYDMPTAEPGGANLGIGGSLVGEITANGSYSDYMVSQIQVHPDTTAGASMSLRWSWIEVA